MTVICVTKGRKTEIHAECKLLHGIKCLKVEASNVREHSNAGFWNSVRVDILVPEAEH
jgi:hypothetical protein